MKVGILTFHFGYNYGGVLQSYALQQYLASQNIDVEIINYVPHSYKPRLIRGTSKSDIIGFLRLIYIKKRHQLNAIKEFEEFRNNYLKCSPKIDNEVSLAALSKQYDTIIVGSDQIWGPAQHKQNIYFLDWSPSFVGSKVSYAPCCAINQICKSNIPKIKKALLDFKALSVRNKETQDFVKIIIGQEPQIVVDPTCLWDFNEIPSCTPIKKSKQYILVYVIGGEIRGGNKKALALIQKQYNNIPIYAISLAAINPKLISYVDKIFYDLSPLEWLSMIRDATFLYTDSFHGVLFALKFKTKFFGYYAEDKRASRFIDLISRFNLQTVLSDQFNITHLHSKTFYLNLFKQYHAQNKSLISQSKEYIKKALM